MRLGILPAVFYAAPVTVITVCYVSLTSLREKLINIGAKVVSHGHYVMFQMAKVAIPRKLFAAIVARIAALRAPLQWRPQRKRLVVGGRYARHFEPNARLGIASARNYAAAARIGGPNGASRLGCLDIHPSESEFRRTLPCA